MFLKTTVLELQNRNGKGTGNVLKLGRSGRERARTEEAEYAHPAVPAPGPEEGPGSAPGARFRFCFYLLF